MLKLSIALCTYNGEKYILEQLRSISNQTRLPDELIICDDNSKDDTVKIIGQFARQAPFPVKLIVNAANLGSTKNFEKAIGHCEGDIIFLSDQDDIWHSNKLETIESVFNRSPSVGLVFSDGILIDSNGNPVNKNLLDTIGYSRFRRYQVSRGEYSKVLLKRNIVTGATMAFRSSYKKYILPVPKHVVHDTWIALIMANFSDLRLLDYPLIKYRIHATQQIGVPLSIYKYVYYKYHSVYKNPYDNHIVYVEKEKKIFDDACDRCIDCSPGINLTEMQGKINHVNARLKILKQGFPVSFITLIKELICFNYFKYSLGINDITLDIFALFRR
jgi:glycosyltransferase involved in cell wall biosynthesis